MFAPSGPPPLLHELYIQYKRKLITKKALREVTDGMSADEASANVRPPPFPAPGSACVSVLLPDVARIVALVDCKPFYMRRCVSFSAPRHVLYHVRVEE